MNEQDQLQRQSPADDATARALVITLGRAWIQQALDDLNRRPSGYQECWRCHDWRPDIDAPCPTCGADWIPF